MTGRLAGWQAIGGVVGLTGALLLGGVRPAAAQYFGQNKVQYRTFDFKIIQTEHFDVYYYDEERQAALDAARMAERAYARLSRILHHEYRVRKPIILYASHSDFEQTNAIGGDLGEGTGGVTEFFKHRMVLPFTGSYAELGHVLQHEMVHQFQYDIYSSGHAGAGVQTISNVNPPLWFMEGMAEYLSLGPIDPQTSMWLRDAALEGHLPTIEQLTYDPRIFPYRYGHAIWAYIGEKWGDEVIGEILQASASSGIEGAFRRALGLSLDELSDEWRDAVQTTFLPQLVDHYHVRRVSRVVLNQKRSDGTYHVAPALTPDGRYVAYFSEKNNFFIDLYVANVETGHVVGQMVKSSINTNYESLRFVNSSGSFAPDGRYFVFTAKKKEREDIVILDAKTDKEERRIHVPVNGVTTPSFSPDGKQIVFVGYDGGLSDLFIVNRDGSGLRRLTNDKYADLHPAWSPDGRTIAFTTDRGGKTDFTELRFGNMRIALYHLDSGTIEMLPHMDYGTNVNPVWAPDGRSLCFLSDRTGIDNIFLYDLGENQVYQLTDVYSGVTGITPLSPALSWARQADRLAFSYYENGDFNVYAIDNPRSLRRQPYIDHPPPGPVLLLASQRTGGGAGAGPPGTGGGGAGGGLRNPAPVAVGDTSGQVSVYRPPQGQVRPSAQAPSGAAAQPAESGAAAPVSIRELLDSATLALPDTAEFTTLKYHVHFSPDYTAQPTIGYSRDNFGRGVFGGAAISLSDMLGDRQLVFAGAINGRIDEAQVLAAYVNAQKRTHWELGLSQQPYYFYVPTTYDVIPIQGSDSAIVVHTNLQRYVYRDLFFEGQRPFSRFDRLELGVHFIDLGIAVMSQNDFYDNTTGLYLTSTQTRGPESELAYVQPRIALVHDNTLFGWVGPFAGSRARFEFSPAIGDRQFFNATADYRRYFFARPFTLAMRGLMYGAFGRDGNQFPIYLGSTELVRGYTSGSFDPAECLGTVNPNSYFGCARQDALVGSRIMVFNAELRFPLTRSLVLGFLPIGLPPVEGAIFFDAGVAWDKGMSLAWNQQPGDNIYQVRAPVRSWGASIRTNVLGFMILRFDYAKPLDRPLKNAYWTVSLGPTF